ncbi:MAG TPA: glycosyltransferase family 4 protein [Planctomycetota bacterium]|nr:glycosyltransferase family 4 protein [Planctomycetota bacterium]HRR81714.1 glycosyltransferase family 4 protein [Planctomycetota bacterium]HRT95576.1 glycosyltransferase family 4 protein [Planctomycetota bacterium]
MRVVYSIGSRLAGGGIGTTAYHAARGIWRAGHLTRLFCLGYEPNDIPADLIRPLWFPSRRYLRLPVHMYWRLKDASFDRRAARRLPEGFDVFHGWNSHCLASLARAKERGALTFVERGSAHAAAQARLLEGEHARFGLRPPRAMRRLVERCVAEYEAADFVHVPSSFCRQSFIDEGFPAQRLVQSPYGVDPSRFAPGPEPDRFTVLFVGEIGLRKGVLDLLEAWARLRLTDSRLVLLGGIEPAIAPRVEEFRRRTAFETPGFGHDMPAAYAGASVLALPAIEDGFPLVVLEAMASGRPVIVSENTGSKDAVENGVHGFVVPIRSPDAIAESLQWLHDRPAERAAMGAAARQRAEQFPWQRHGADLVALYESARR